MREDLILFRHNISFQISSACDVLFKYFKRIFASIYHFHTDTRGNERIDTLKKHLRLLAQHCLKAKQIFVLDVATIHKWINKRFHWPLFNLITEGSGYTTDTNYLFHQWTSWNCLLTLLWTYRQTILCAVFN